MRILIVDDSSATLNALRIGLTSFGYRVATASSGAEAIRIIVETLHGKGKPDLLMTDFKMPKMNGIQLIQMVRAVNAKLPVILMTGYGDKILSRKILGLERFAYMEKPFQPEDLVRVIQRLKVEASGQPAADEACAVIDENAWENDRKKKQPINEYWENN